MSKIHWEAVARILLYGIRVDYFPLQLSSAFLIGSLFGEQKITNKMYIESFKNYVTIDEKELIQDTLKEFNASEELLDLLSYYKCYRKPTEENIVDIFLELAHQELVQRPRYVSNCFSNQFARRKLPAEFENVDGFISFYNERKPTANKIVKNFSFSPKNDQESAVFDHLCRYVKSLSSGDMKKFLQYVTGGDLMPSGKIEIAMVDDQTPRSPVARICVPMIELSSSYSKFNELAEELNNILNNRESFLFSFG